MAVKVFIPLVPVAMLYCQINQSMHVIAIVAHLATAIIYTSETFITLVPSVVL
jgi:hypothetical protein